MASVWRIAGTLAVTLAFAPGTCMSAQAEDTGQVRALTAAYNASGHDLFVKFAAKPGNIVFSPYSIGTAMAMALAGARGDTATEMARVLRHTLPREAIDVANAGALATLNGYDKGVPPCPQSMAFDRMLNCEAPLPKDGVCTIGDRIGERCVTGARFVASARLKAVNALMLPNPYGDAVLPAYVRLLNDTYRAEVFRGATVDDVNGWVSRQTEGRIDRLIDRIDPDVVAMILNAVYFNATWQVPFFKTDTRDDDFNLAPTERVKVATMHREGFFAVLAGAGYRAVRLPYSVGALSMVVVLPDDIAGAADLARDLDAAKVAALFRDLKDHKKLKLALPRFKTSFETELKDVFKQAGMIRAFDQNLADFSAMFARSDIRPAIGAVVHRAVIDVNEEGTEAAAATLVAMRTSANWAQPEPFVVDRPFLFYIVDEASGAILFQGRISDPRTRP
jgi:serpin B